VDGTKYEIYVDNLVAEFHIRYGGYGAIAYHYVADNYIALFSRFFPCGVWEAVYIVDGLLQQQSKAEPKEIHADTGSRHHPAQKQRLGSRPHNERPGCLVLLRVSAHVG
jgi:TnpA family transposase